jgi:hypothetical protein
MKPQAAEEAAQQNPKFNAHSDLSVSSFSEAILKDALTLFDLGFADFDECVKILKECKNDIEAACERLLSKARMS